MSDSQPLTYLNALAISCLATGLIDEAEPAFKHISEQLPDHSAGPVGLASVELARGNFDAACQILRDNISQNHADSDQTRRILFNALVAANRVDEADRLQQSLIAIDAANDDTEYLRAAHQFFGTRNPNG